MRGALSEIVPLPLVTVDKTKIIGRREPVTLLIDLDWVLNLDEGVAFMIPRRAAS